jgi:hypothetical protein
MACQFLTLLLFLTLAVVSAAAQDGINSFTSRDAFSAAAADIKVNDFEGIVPASGFKQYQREGSLKYVGAEFRPAGGGRFGPGAVIVVGGWYNAGPAFETTSGAKLHWSPPNQPGDAYLDITLPSGTTAVGLDLWTAQPPQSAVEVTATTADGKSRSETITTPARPAAGFIGFVSMSPIVSIRITPPKGQTGVIIDNFTLGNAKPGWRGSEQNRSENPTSSSQPPLKASLGPGYRNTGPPTSRPSMPCRQLRTARPNERVY